jgi:hypothetical protein
MSVIVVLLAVILAWAFTVRSLRRAVMLSRSCLLLILALCMTVAPASANSNKTLYCVSTIAACGGGITQESIARSAVPSIACGYDARVLLSETLDVVATKPGTNPATVTETETMALNPMKASDATGAWDDFLGPGEHNNINPRTGQADPNRIFSADGTRSIRMGPHEMNSSPTKFHYHQETWTYDPATNNWHVDNVVQRVPGKK